MRFPSTLHLHSFAERTNTITRYIAHALALLYILTTCGLPAFNKATVTENAVMARRQWL